LRKYADIISQGGTPISAPAYPGTDPSVPRFLTQLINQGFAGAANRAASRADERTKLERRNFARAIVGLEPIDVSMPKPTGLLARLDRLAGFGDTIADDGSAIAPALPALTKGKDGQIDIGAVISAAGPAGIDEVAAVNAALGLQKTRSDLAATELSAERAQNLREATSLFWQIEEAEGAPDATKVARLKELSANLPAELPAVGYETIDVEGKSAIVRVDILGRPVGSPVFAPAPLIDRGVSETAKLEARKEVVGTVGQIAVDQAFGKEYNEFIALGGFADVDANREKVRIVLQDLKDRKLNLTGTDIGLLTVGGRVGLSLFNEPALNALETVEEVVQRNLRVILGAQFTEKEGTRLIARAYNPWLSEETNALRLERLLDSMDTQLEAKFKAVRWYEDYDTLRGFKGDIPNLEVVQDMADSLVAGVPDVAVIKSWDGDYIESLMTNDNRMTAELKRILADPVAKEALIRRGIELGIPGWDKLLTE
jgi:hypothetical protein